jgi:hypothetical protein
VERCNKGDLYLRARAGTSAKLVAKDVLTVSAPGLT